MTPITCPVCQDNGLRCWCCRGTGKVATREEEERDAYGRELEWDRRDDERRAG